MDAGVTVEEIPTLPYTQVDGRRLPVPYVNFYVGNGVVVVPVSGAPTDADALAQIGSHYPGSRGRRRRRARARVRWRWRALHHPTRPGRAVIVRTAFELLESPARVDAPRRQPLRVALVQERWRSDARAHAAALGEGVARAADTGARLVCLQELTLSPYFATTPAGTPAGPGSTGIEPEHLPGGRTHTFAHQLAAAHDLFVHASLYEYSDDDGSDDGGPDGEARRR